MKRTKRGRVKVSGEEVGCAMCDEPTPVETITDSGRCISCEEAFNCTHDWEFIDIHGLEDLQCKFCKTFQTFILANS